MPPFKAPKRTQYGWTLQLFKAIHHMHSQNPIIIHRDLKPSNILLSEDLQTLKIADFGTAKTIHLSQRDVMVHAGRNSGNHM